MFRIGTFAVLTFTLLSAHSLPFVGRNGLSTSRVATGILYPYDPNIKPYTSNTKTYSENRYFDQYNSATGRVSPILTYSNEQSGDGSYAFSFTTADGKQAQENGFIKDVYIDNVGEPQRTQVVQGSFAYISPEGIPIQVNYVADENGFRPSEVQIPSNGKSSSLSGINDRNGKLIVHPFYDRYKLYNSRRHYGQYKAEHFRYPHNTARYNPYYNDFLAVKQNQITGENIKQ